jgi:PKD repeat protein
MQVVGYRGVSDPLVADFDAPGGVLDGTPVDFTNTSHGGMPNPATGEYSYLWNFGDGTTSTEKDPTHTYPGLGTYTVSLKVTPYHCVPVTVTKTIQVVNQTGYLLPTNTTVQMFAGDPSAWPPMYDAFKYTVKDGRINSVSPGVIFYYNTITAPAGDFTLRVIQSNEDGWKPMLVQKKNMKLQAYLYDAATFQVVAAGTGTGGNVTFDVTNATPGALYYVGVKYSAANLVGQQPTGAPNLYTFLTKINGAIQYGSEASIPVQKK